jgi:hypothetical protein
MVIVSEGLKDGKGINPTGLIIKLCSWKVMERAGQLAKSKPAAKNQRCVFEFSVGRFAKIKASQ